METSITIRTKPIKGNKERLYLDFYPAIVHPETGISTRREFLPLHIYSEIERKEVKAKTATGKTTVKYVSVFDKDGEPKKIRLSQKEKEYNKEKYRTAEKIRGMRLEQVDNEEYGFIKKTKNVDFLPFILELAEKQKTDASISNYKVLHSHLSNFTNNNCPVKKLTPSFCDDFRDYLSNTLFKRKTKSVKLASSTVIVYLAIFKTALRKAKKKGLIKSYPAENMEVVKNDNAKQREYLTLSELQAVVKGNCELPVVKRAAIFSALTGLRHSDVKKLTWGEVLDDNGQLMLRFTMQKKKNAVTLPITNEAIEYMGKRKSATDLVFEGLIYGGRQKRILKDWLKASGIEKHITFHCFRHSFATLNLTLGNDIYRVSKLLGHSKISTTEIYAKIIDERMREAVDKIKIS